MKLSLYLLVLVCTATSFVSCKDAQTTQKTINLEIPDFTKEGELRLFKSSGKHIRTIDIEVADTPYEQELDLKHRNALAPHQGMLFLYPQSELRGYYMKDIRFPLDLIFIGPDNKVVSFKENAKALDETTFLPSQVPAQLVLKINGGLSEEWVIEVGDYIEWEFIE